MDDCNRFAELKKLQEELCSDSSMDDCNRTIRIQFALWKIVQIPLWTIVTIHLPGQAITPARSDSSKDDCNPAFRLVSGNEFACSDSSMDDCNP